MHFYNFRPLLLSIITFMLMQPIYSMENPSDYTITISPSLLNAQLSYQNTVVHTQSTTPYNAQLIRNQADRVITQAIFHTIKIAKDEHFIISNITNTYTPAPIWTSGTNEQLAIFNPEDKSSNVIFFDNGNYRISGEEAGQFHGGLGTALYRKHLKLVAVHPYKPLLLCEDKRIFKNTFFKVLAKTYGSIQHKCNHDLTLLEITPQDHSIYPYTIGYADQSLLTTETFALPTILDTSFDVQK